MIQKWMNDVDCTSFSVILLQGEIICKVKLGQASWHWKDYASNKEVFLYTCKVASIKQAKVTTMKNITNGHFISIIMTNTNVNDLEVVGFK